jgi:hypothetical protein
LLTNSWLPTVGTPVIFGDDVFAGGGLADGGPADAVTVAVCADVAELAHPLLLAVTTTAIAAPTSELVKV